MGKLLLILCLIASISFGADELDYISAYSFFDQILILLGTIFRDIQKDFFGKVSSIYISGTLSAMLTLVILIYAVRKIKEGEFKIPNDIIEIIIFLLMILFVNYCLNNYSNIAKIINYIEIPADTISKAVLETTDARKNTISNGYAKSSTMGFQLQELVRRIEETQKMMIGSTSSNPFKTILEVFLKFILWLVYAWFAFILIVSISMTYILTFLQAEFWKMFGVIMIPLIYFKATRGMVIFWVKTIIALSLISSFVTIIAYLAVISEQRILSILGSEFNWELEKGMGMKYHIIAAIVISKIILITFLKEIPAMINGMLGTQAGGSTGAFANSVAMGSIGAAAAGAGFTAFKGAMGIKNLALGKKGSSGGKNADTGSASSEGLLQKTAKLTGNVTKGFGSTIATGLKNSNSSTAQKIGQGMSNIAQGASNLSQGKAWGTPKTPPK